MIEVTRLFDLLAYQQAKYPKKDALAWKNKGTWETFSTADVQTTVNQVSKGFIALGLKRDAKVAIISPNRPHFNFIDFGLQQIGAVSVPIYPTITTEDYAYIFNDAEVQYVFVYDKDIYLKAAEAVKQAPCVKEIFSFLPVDGVRSWDVLTSIGKGTSDATLDTLKEEVKGTDLLTLIYTSGTTGKPKGVMLTHDNIISNYKACTPLMPVNEAHRALSFLPMCHIYERMLVYLYMSVGVSIYYAESLETIADNLKEVKPHIFTTVPRLLEKVYDKIVAKGSELTGTKKALFFWALQLGLKYEINKDQGFWYNSQLALANKLIFSKWREALGGNIRAVVSGSAALQPRLAKVFWAAQIPVMEGYGLTETSPVISVNRVDAMENRIGTVGPLIEGVEVSLAADGEILTRGPHIMKGYYKRPDLTAEVIDADGWFHTGDIGTFIEGKYLKITDRKKEMFKTSGGKYVAPQLLENKFKESRYVEQIMIVGEGQKFPGALIVPSFDSVRSWCAIKGIPYTTDAEMIQHESIIQKFQREIDELNEHFAQYEKVKKFALLPALWSIDGGELTPTMKLKRKIIAQKYAGLIEKLYID